MPLQIGDVFYWESDQAVGYRLRNKYHVYMCEGDWRTQGEIFLFVNKSNAHLGYEIKNPPYTFLKYDASYISCTGVIPVPGDAQFGDPVGRISDVHLKELRSFIANSEVMPGYDIQRICAAIDAHIK